MPPHKRSTVVRVLFRKTKSNTYYLPTKRCLRDAKSRGLFLLLLLEEQWEDNLNLCGGGSWTRVKILHHGKMVVVGPKSYRYTTVLWRITHTKPLEKDGKMGASCITHGAGGEEKKFSFLWRNLVGFFFVLPPPIKNAYADFFYAKKEPCQTYPRLSEWGSLLLCCPLDDVLSRLWLIAPIRK